MAALAVSPPGVSQSFAGDGGRAAAVVPPAVVVAAAPAPTPSGGVGVDVVPAADPSLPLATVESIVAAPQVDAGLDDVVGIAVPKADRTTGFDAPGGHGVLVISRSVPGEPRVWLAVGREPGWVQVLVPLGRGALPSVDPGAVNGRAVWVPEAAVDVGPIDSRVVVDVSERTATITSAARQTVTVPVGVGVEGVSDTPVGLGYVVDFFEDPHLGTVALTSMQSTRLDGFGGADFALTAFHADPEGGRAVGQARSNGCIRMYAQDFAELMATLPLGTPVLVQP